MKESRAQRLLWIFSHRSLRATRDVNAFEPRSSNCTHTASHYSTNSGVDFAKRDASAFTVHRPARRAHRRLLSAYKACRRLRWRKNWRRADFSFRMATSMRGQRAGGRGKARMERSEPVAHATPPHK